MGNASRVNYCWVAVIMALILSLAWFFVGVEQVSGEFREDTEYVFFIKKHMSTKIFFVDPTNCNAGCDTPLLTNLNEKKSSNSQIIVFIDIIYLLKRIVITCCIKIMIELAEG